MDSYRDDKFEKLVSDDKQNWMKPEIMWMTKEEGRGKRRFKSTKIKPC